MLRYVLKENEWLCRGLIISIYLPFSYVKTDY